ncbi:hypothetical protein [Pseudactinotalea sp. Z1732]|uniref:hypothetical protein n=1 Tax=Micrococcales TaxID=85006 RepID=UPI003C7D4EC0
MTEPTIAPTLGGRGPDWEAISAARTAPHQHAVHVTTVSQWTTTGRPTPREAFDSRRKRLRDAGTEHHADPKTLTLTFTERGGDHVTLTYAPIEGTS